eukprot:scaffold11.g3940.t1
MPIEVLVLNDSNDWLMGVADAVGVERCLAAAQWLALCQPAVRKLAVHVGEAGEDDAALRRALLLGLASIHPRTALEEVEIVAPQDLLDELLPALRLFPALRKACLGSHEPWEEEDERVEVRLGSRGLLPALEELECSSVDAVATGGLASLPRLRVLGTSGESAHARLLNAASESLERLDALLCSVRIAGALPRLRALSVRASKAQLDVRTLPALERLELIADRESLPDMFDMFDIAAPFAALHGARDSSAIPRRRVLPHVEGSREEDVPALDAELRGAAGSLTQLTCLACYETPALVPTAATLPKLVELRMEGDGFAKERNFKMQKAWSRRCCQRPSCAACRCGGGTVVQERLPWMKVETHYGLQDPWHADDNA